MSRLTRVWLLDVKEVGRNQEHFLEFPTLSSQIDWYLSNNHLLNTVDNCYYQKENKTYIDIPFSFEDVETCNYVVYLNKERYYFCFVNDKQYLAPRSTRLQLEIDYLSTYWHEIEFNDCFVDRCHQNRNEVNIVNEGLELGDHYFSERNNIFESDNNNIVIASSTPLGKIDKPPFSNINGGGVVATASSIMNKNMHYSQGRPTDVVPTILSSPAGLDWTPPLSNDLSNCGYGIDCSLLVQWAYHKNGISVSRTTYTQVNDSNGQNINWLSAQPGDCIYCNYDGQYQHVVMLLQVNGMDSFTIGEAKSSKVPLENQVCITVVTGKTIDNYFSSIYSSPKYTIRRFS